MTLVIDSAATFCSCTQLRSKTLDLNKAGEKHYQLEQELAFYKIDSKFHNLAFLYLPASVNWLRIDNEDARNYTFAQAYITMRRSINNFFVEMIGI